MTLYDCTDRAAGLLQLDDVRKELKEEYDRLNEATIGDASKDTSALNAADTGEQSSEQANPDNEESAEILGVDAKLIIECAHTVIGEIASDFMPLKVIEEVSTDSAGEIVYADLSEELADVYALRRKGMPVRFKVLFDRVIAPSAGVYTLVYSRRPQRIELNQPTAYDKSLINEDIIAYGIARDFCIITGRSADAAIWEQRYKNALENTLMPKSLQKLRARGWY